MYVTKCTICKWQLVFVPAEYEKAKLICQSHIQYHADQMVLDVESFLTEEAEK